MVRVQHRPPQRVSILTRPWGRVQRGINGRYCPPMGAFQSSPARWGGCNQTRRYKSARRKRFNPHPPVGAGATRGELLQMRYGDLFQSSPARGGGCNLALEVDTLTVGGFNPHPPVGAGATESAILARANCARFNPHPPVGAGATRRSRGVRPATHGFNPHPPVGAGATLCCAKIANRARVVSILTRPWGRVQRFCFCSLARAYVVSILTRPWGRVQPFTSLSNPKRRDVSILTRPWGRVQLGANRHRCIS